MAGNVAPSAAPVPAAPSAASPSLPIAPAPAVAGAARVRTWRVASSAMTVVLFILMNGLLQLDRRYFDLVSQDSSYPALPHVQACESLGRPPDVLYLGSSLALHGVAPGIADAAVRQSTGRMTLGCNAGVDAASYVTNYFVLSRMIEDGYKPRMVVYVVNEAGLTTEGPDPQEAVNALWLAGLQDAELLQPPLASGPSGWPGRAAFYASKLIPLYGDRVGVAKSVAVGALSAVCLLRPPADPCHAQAKPAPLVEANGQVILPADRQGWVGLSGISLATVGPQVIAQNLPPCGASCPRWAVYQQGRQLEYFKDTLALARANRVPVALVISPRPQAFFAHFFGTSANWATVTTFYRTTANAYGATFYDASHAPGYTNADFADSWHLTVSGAAIFSNWLGDHVVGPLAAG
jgi:hypothetical protein